MSVVKDEDQDFVINIVMSAARSGSQGHFGDGKIFVSKVEDVSTISSGVRDTAPQT
jgi:nitrogen regulatory protein PII 1